MSLSKTNSFLIKALRIKSQGLVTRDNFDAHELLEWAMFFATEAGYTKAHEWYEDTMYPIRGSSTRQGTSYL